MLVVMALVLVVTKKIKKKNKLYGKDVSKCDELVFSWNDGSGWFWGFLDYCFFFPNCYSCRFDIIWYLDVQID